jgi:hypothetical protein
VHPLCAASARISGRMRRWGRNKIATSGGDAIVQSAHRNRGGQKSTVICLLTSREYTKFWRSRGVHSLSQQRMITAIPRATLPFSTNFTTISSGKTKDNRIHESSNYPWNRESVIFAFRIVWLKIRFSNTVRVTNELRKHLRLRVLQL